MFGRLKTITLNFIKTRGAERINQDTVIILSDLLQLYFQFCQFRIRQKTFEDTLVDALAPRLQKFDDVPPFLVVFNIVRDDHVFFHTLPLPDIRGISGCLPGEVCCQCFGLIDNYFVEAHLDSAKFFGCVDPLQHPFDQLVACFLT